MYLCDDIHRLKIRIVINSTDCCGYLADVVLCDGWTDYDLPFCEAFGFVVYYYNFCGWSRFFKNDTILINYIARE